MIANANKNSTGKLLVAVLALVMVMAAGIAVFSVSSDAATSYDQASLQTALNEGDVTLENEVAVSTGTLNLNDNALIIASGGKLTIDQGATVTNGNITVSGQNIGTMFVLNGGTLSDATVKANGTDVGSYGIYVQSGTIAGVTFTDYRMAISLDENVKGNVSITNCIFGDGGKAAIYIQGTSTSPAPTISISNNEYGELMSSGAEASISIEVNSLAYIPTIDVNDTTSIYIRNTDSGAKQIDIGTNLLVDNITDLTVYGENTTVDVSNSLTVDNILGDGSIDVDGAEASITADAAVTSVEITTSNGGESNITTTINDGASTVDELNEALQGDDPIVRFDGTITSSDRVVVPANKTLDLTEATIQAGSTLVVNGQNAIIQIGNGSGKSFNIENGLETNNSSVSVNGIYGSNITIGYGSVVIGGTNISGTITVTTGTLTLSDDTVTSPTGGKLTINAVGGTTVNLGNLTVNGDGGLEIVRTSGDSAVTVTGEDIELSGNITLTGVINMTVGDLTGNGTISVPAGSTFTYASKTTGVTITGDGIIKIDGAQGTEQIISSSQTINGTYYLTGNTIINENVVLTIGRNSTLNLMGFNLTVYGEIIIERNGVITNLNTSSTGGIVLRSTGSIQNEGIIGDTMPITITNGENPEVQTVTMQGVTGVNLTMDRSTADRDVYNLYVSGDVSRVTGTDVHTLEINNVDIDGDMSIGSSVEFTVNGNVDVGKGYVFTNNGTYMEISEDATFKLLNGASAVLNSPTKGTITVEVGQIESGDEFVAETPAKSTVKLDGNKVTTNTPTTYKGTTGITISVDRITVPNERDPTVSDVYQQMYVNGTLQFENTDRNDDTSRGSVEFNGEVFVDGTLSIPDDVKVTTATGYLNISEAGMIVVADESDTVTQGTGAIAYYGAKYVVETTVENAPIETTYYTTFAAAMEQIANAQSNLVTVSGQFEISGTYELTGEQVIEADGNNGVNQIVVADDGQITVGVDATIDNDVFYTIEGRVIVTEGVGYRPNATVGTGENVHYIYSVRTTDDDNTTTYSGFGVAIDNATAGQTVTVVGDAEYDGNLVIPAQVTVDVDAGISLTVLGNVTVEAEGTLNLDNGSYLYVGRDNARDYTVTVSGTLDATEGGFISRSADNSGKINLYSTGTTALVNALVNVTPNAAYYEDGGETVYTSLSNAVAYAEQEAIRTVNATGTFTETGAIESDGVNIVIAANSVVTLGDLTLTGAQISVAGSDESIGRYTANVSGPTGAGDATTTSTVSVNRTTATVASVGTLNAEGVTEYKLTIDSIVGNTSVTAGTVEVDAEDGYSISTGREQTLTVTSGATLLITGNVGISGAYITNNGTIEIDDEAQLAISATVEAIDAVLPGDVLVGEGATLLVDDSVVLTVTGTVTVDAEGSFNLNGYLYLGEQPRLLDSSATGEVVGEITMDADAIVYVYNGASVEGAEFANESVSDVKATSYVINGIGLLEVYTFASNVNIDNTTIDGIVRALDDLNTPTTDSVPYNVVWHAGDVTITNEVVGNYAEVTTEIQYESLYVIVSVGSHITLSIDGVVLGSTTSYPLTIGTHTVTATVDPGFSGDVTITFNGQTVTNGEIEITSDMLASIDNIVLSANGQLTQDATIIDGGSSGSEMGLTDYLLIVLVVLIVIMAIMVALRLMRS